MQQALIIFIRNPVSGTVKTRLAKTVGNEKALNIYKKLLQYTHDITSELHCDKYVFYADEITANDIWENNNYKKNLQTNGDLGKRMHAAFDVLFKSDYERVCIIGSDCYELTTGIIQRAFNALPYHDVVIGPSADGGYYLLGLRRMQPALFANIEWSTGKVLAQTIDACIACTCSYTLLPVLNDIDDEQDWIAHQSKTASL